jgi:DNA-binding IclR family transcriptional regulator
MARLRRDSSPPGDRAGAGVRSVQLALDVLEAIAFSGDELGVTQLADRLGVTKGSVHRHLHTLVERGYLTQNAATARYAIGPKSRLLARFAPDADLIQVAEGTMRELRDRLGHTVVLSAMTPRGALVLTTLASTSPIEIGVRPGSELPFHASAQGKVLLAFAPRPVQERILARPLERFTDRTIVERERIEAELVRIARHGYASAPEEVLLGINVMAAPIFDERDNCIGALAIVGSIQYLPETPDPDTVEALKDYGKQISRRFGHGRGPGDAGGPAPPRAARRGPGP